MKVVADSQSRDFFNQKTLFIPGFVGLFIFTFVLITLSTHDWDPLAFVLERPDDIPAEQTWGVGYDGQQAFAIARDPQNAAPMLDLPAYRYMRIIYPIAARITALGIDELIPWTLIAINLIAAVLTSWVIGKLIVEQGGEIWAAALGILTFNYLIGIRMDLNEPLALCFAFCGLYAFKHERLKLSLLLFALGVLTKEIVFAFPLAIGAHEIFHRRYKRGLLLWLGSTLPYFIWAGIVTLWQGESPFSNGLSRPLLVPFLGVRDLPGLESQIMIWLWMIIPILVMILLIGSAAITNLQSLVTIEALLVLTNAAVVATLPSASWVDPLAVLRLGLGVLLCSILWLNRYKPRGLYYAAAIFLPSLMMIVLIPGFLL